MSTSVQMLVLLMTVNYANRFVRGSTTTMENVSRANICTYNIQYSVLAEVTVTVRQSVRRRCNIGSVTDLLGGKCLGMKYVTAYRSVPMKRNETRVMTKTERGCCNGTTQVDGVCIKEQVPVTTQHGPITTQFSNGSLVPVLVVVTVLAVVGIALAVCIYRRKNIYTTPQEPKQLGIANAVYQMEKDKSTSNHTYVLPDDPSYLKLDSRRVHSTQNVYDSVPSSKAQPPTGDLSYEKLNRENMTMSQNVYDQIKTYTQLNQGQSD